VLKSAEERYKFPEDNPFVDSDEEGEVINVFTVFFKSKLYRQYPVAVLIFV
jgi:hypothetical protein